MELLVIQEKAIEMKCKIQDALNDFNHDTGLTPEVEILTLKKETNCGAITVQKVVVKIMVA